MTSSNPVDDPVGTVRRSVVNGKVFVKSDDHGLPVWNRVFGADNRSFHEKCASEALPFSVVIGAVPGTPAARLPDTEHALRPVCNCGPCQREAAARNAPIPYLRRHIAEAIFDALEESQRGRGVSPIHTKADVDTAAGEVLKEVQPTLERLTTEGERLQVELGTIRGELADFAQESMPSHVSTLQAVRWLIAEHDEQVKHNEEVGEENRALCDERDELAATVSRLRAGNAEYAKVFATWQSLWDEKEEWEKAAKEAWQRENVGAWLVAEARWLLRGMASRASKLRRSREKWRRLAGKQVHERVHDMAASMANAGQLRAENRRVKAERDEALAALKKQQEVFAGAIVPPADAVNDLIAFWHTKHNEFLDDAARDLLARWGARGATSEAASHEHDRECEHVAVPDDDHPVPGGYLCGACGSKDFAGDFCPSRCPVGDVGAEAEPTADACSLCLTSEPHTQQDLEWHHRNGTDGWCNCQSPTSWHPVGDTNFCPAIPARTYDVLDEEPTAAETEEPA